MFARLTIHGWRQFDDIDVEFHPRLTVLTGANGSGKTSILNLLSMHFGWNLQFLSVPTQSKQGVLQYLSGLFRRRDVDRSSAGEVGSLSYSGGQSSQILIREAGSPTYQVSIPSLVSLPGLFIPSHRPVSVYQPVGQIATSVPPRDAMFQNYLNEYRGRHHGSYSGYSPAYRIKEALISLATFGYGNAVVSPNEEAMETYQGFEQILSTVLPESLGFEGLSIRMPEVVLQTRTGDFPFDALSGGLAAIIDLAWQIYLLSLSARTFNVVIDEPENHLHPELQRSLFPTLIKAFPTAQFVAATHNPFIVGAVPDAHVYVLHYNDAHRVESLLLDTANKAGTSNEILRDVLGLRSVTAIWVEDRIHDIVERYASAPLTAERLQALRAEMATLGLESLFPTSLDRVVNKGRD